MIITYDTDENTPKECQYPGFWKFLRNIFHKMC